MIAGFSFRKTKRCIHVLVNWYNISPHLTPQFSVFFLSNTQYILAMLPPVGRSALVLSHSKPPIFFSVVRYTSLPQKRIYIIATTENLSESGVCLSLTGYQSTRRVHPSVPLRVLKSVCPLLRTMITYKKVQVLYHSETGLSNRRRVHVCREKKAAWTAAISFRRGKFRRKGRGRSGMYRTTPGMHNQHL